MIAKKMKNINIYTTENVLIPVQKIQKITVFSV